MNILMKEDYDCLYCWKTSKRIVLLFCYFIYLYRRYDYLKAPALIAQTQTYLSSLITL